jgi:hypothetical protein
MTVKELQEALFEALRSGQINEEDQVAIPLAEEYGEITRTTSVRSVGKAPVEGFALINLSSY